MHSYQVYTCMSVLFLSAACLPWFEYVNVLSLTKPRVDPEVDQNVCQIIRGKGFPCEDHTVVTDDGYILAMQRIPFGRAGSSDAALRPPVFLQHGLLDSAHTWTINLINQSLGFILADAGFDVWMGNSRGSTYSSRHKTLDVKSKEFWEFSWDEMAEFDLPAFIHYVLKQTSAKRLAYVGHSQGTEMAFARFGSDPHLSSKVSAFVAFGPVTTLAHVESPIRHIARLTSTLNLASMWFGSRRFMPTSLLVKKLGENWCTKKIISSVCSNIIFLIAGFSESNTNVTRLPVYVAHTPAGTSVQNVVHYSQAFLSKKFQKFDFGLKGNLARYDQPNPPLYSVANLTIPTAFFWGGNDWLASPTDAVTLLSKIAGTVKFSRYMPHYNHLDFVWGMDAGSTIYRDTVDFLKKFHSPETW